MNDAKPPRNWQFSGWLSDHTSYKVELCGQPALRQVQQLIAVLQLYEKFLIEDKAALTAFQNGSVMLGEADRPHAAAQQRQDP